MWWSGRQNRKLRTDELTLVAEATALLTGHAARSAPHAEGETPAWARVNFLAHARPQLLVRQLDSERCSASGSFGDRWLQIRHHLLREIVELTGGRTGPIAQLQRECLIPLELQLMGTSFRITDPGEILNLALASLQAHPIALRRRIASPPER